VWAGGIGAAVTSASHSGGAGVSASGCGVDSGISTVGNAGAVRSVAASGGAAAVGVTSTGQASTGGTVGACVGAGGAGTVTVTVNSGVELVGGIGIMGTGVGATAAVVVGVGSGVCGTSGGIVVLVAGEGILNFVDNVRHVEG